jgi:hypothetical protein
MKNDNLVKRLAGDAVAQSEGYILKKGESTAVNEGALHQVIAEALLNWQMIEGVEFRLAPLVKVEEVKAEGITWRNKMAMFGASADEDNIITFDNPIILN